MTPKSDGSAPSAPRTDLHLEARFDALVREEYARLAELASILLRNRTDAEDMNPLHITSGPFAGLAIISSRMLAKGTSGAR